MQRTSATIYNCNIKLQNLPEKLKKTAQCGEDPATLTISGGRLYENQCARKLRSSPCSRRCCRMARRPRRSVRSQTPTGHRISAAQNDNKETSPNRVRSQNKLT
jgi:hypothetical protein